MDGLEYGFFGPARIAQLEQENLQRYQRSILQNPSYHADAAPDYQDEFQSKLLELMDMMRQFRNDLKSISSLSEDENEPDAMPVSDNADFGAWNHSDLGSDPTDESLYNGMSSFDNLNGNESSNSEEMLAFEEAVVSESAINSGFKVLSIYCAHMAPKWNNILEMRPQQRNDLSVEDYYTQFFAWKRKLEEVNYMGDEDSYIDDFLYGLKTELAVRVWVYKWKPRTLYGAFRRAEIEETMMKNDAHMVFDKMPPSNPIDIQDALVAVKWLDLTECSKREHRDGPVFGDIVVQKRARKVFAEMIGPNLEAELLGIKATNAAHYLLDNSLTLSPVNSDEGLYGTNKHFLSSYPYIIQTSSRVNRSIWVPGVLLNLSKVNTQHVSYKDDVLGVSVTNSPSLSKLEFNPQVFDPGSLAFFKQEEYERQLHCISSELFLVYAQVYEAEIFINNSDISPLTHDVWSIRPFTDFCVGALAQLRTTYDQAATRVTNGHHMVLNDSDLYITAVGLLTQRLPFEIFGCQNAVLQKVMHHNTLLSEGLKPTTVWARQSNTNELLVVPLLFGKDHGISVTAIAGVVSSLMHVHSTLLSEFPYMLDIDNYKSNEVFMLFSNLSSYITQALGYKAVVLWVSFNNFPSMSRWESNPQVVDPSADANKGRLNENIGQMKLYGSMLFPSEVYFLYNTSDQASPRLNNRHDISAGNDKVHFRAANMLCQRVPFEAKYCFIDFSHFRMCVSDSPATIYLLFDGVARRDSLYKSLFKGANFMNLRKCLHCWTLSWDIQSNEMRLSRLGSMICLLFSLRTSFAWDPGICVFLVYILEDKDVFKRVGKRILAMVMVSIIKDKVVCQLKIWNSFPGLQMSIEEERYMLQVWIVDHMSLGSSFNLVKMFSRDFKERAALLKLGPEQIDNYVNDCLRVFKSYVNKELIGHSEIICNNILMKWSSMESHTTFCSNILKHGMYGNAFEIIYHSLEIHLAAAVKSMILTHSEREIQDCSYDMGHFIWDPGLWSILHYNGLLHTTLYKCGCIALMIPFMKMLYLRRVSRKLQLLPMCPFSIIFLYSRSMCALLLYPNAQACWCFGIYKCNEECCFIKMYEIPAFVFRPP